MVAVVAESAGSKPSSEQKQDYAKAEGVQDSADRPALDFITLARPQQPGQKEMKG